MGEELDLGEVSGCQQSPVAVGRPVHLANRKRQQGELCMEQRALQGTEQRTDGT